MPKNKGTSTFFSPQAQDVFWGGLDPDIRAFLDSFERDEDWTYEFEELPELFIQTALALPKVVELPPQGYAQEIIYQLIPLLSSMPLRQSVSAIAWLDNHIINESALGWGVVCYMTAVDITRDKENDPIYLESKVVYERIQMMLRSSLSSLLFCNLNIS